MFRSLPDGAYWVIDEVTGEQFPSTEMVEDWDGSLRRQTNADGKHPDFWPKRYPPEHFPRDVNAVVEAVYVTAATAGGRPVVFYEGTDIPRPLE